MTEVHETFLKNVTLANQLNYQDFFKFFTLGLMPRMKRLTNQPELSISEAFQIDLVTPVCLLFNLTSKLYKGEPAIFAAVSKPLKQCFPFCTQTIITKNGSPLVCCQVYSPDVDLSRGSESFTDIFSQSVYQCISKNTCYGVFLNSKQSFAFKLDLTDEVIRKIKRKTELLKEPDRVMKKMFKSVKVKFHIPPISKEKSLSHLQSIMVALVDMAERDLSTHAGRAKSARLLKNLSSVLRLTKEEYIARVDKELDDCRRKLAPNEECRYWQLEKSHVTVVKQGEYTCQNLILNQAAVKRLTDKKSLKDGPGKYVLKIFDPFHMKHEREGNAMSSEDCWKRARELFLMGKGFCDLAGSISTKGSTLHLSGFCHLMLEGTEEPLGGWFLLSHDRSDLAAEAAFEALNEQSKLTMQTVRQFEKQFPGLSHTVTDLGNGKYFLSVDPTGIP